MVTSIRIDRNVPVEVRDGCVLKADIYCPADGARHPAILFRTPYDKSTSGNSDYLNLVQAAHAGYAIVVQDVRGRFASAGEWRRENMFIVEGLDGFDTVEWIASQRWCDGNVGSAGGSYLAGLQWTTAMESPPHLKAMAPWMGITGPGMEPPPTGGAILLTVAMTATPMMAVDIANRLEQAGQDVTELRAAILWAQSDPAEALNFLPLKDIPFARFDRIRETWNMRLNPPSESEHARRQRFDRVQVPCFYACGWYDIIEWATFECYRAMREQGGTPLARQGQHVLVGPWTHGQPIQYLGEMNFGAAAGPVGAQLTAHNLAFFDKYLCGKEIAIPVVRYFTMGRDSWQTAEDWPLPQTAWQRFYLHSRGKANTAEGDGVLNRDEPGTEPPDFYIYNPHTPVPSVGGRVIGSGVTPGPIDQSRIERRRDVLCYTSAELQEEVEVTGPLSVHLCAATSACDTDWTAKLVDVYPDGRAYNIVEGIKRASGRNLDGTHQPVTPGEAYEYLVTMGDTSIIFRKGHRIRLEISSSNFPTFDRNMNTGNPIGEDARGIPALQTVLHSTGHASYLDLPVIPRSAS